MNGFGPGGSGGPGGPGGVPTATAPVIASEVYASSWFTSTAVPAGQSFII